jgi:hypothetical protein
MIESQQPKRGTLLRPLARAWFRGPAVRVRDAIVMDGRRAERYEPLTEPRIGVELARVRTPDEAVSFVARFGMLNSKSLVLDGEPCPVEIRQPFAEFERPAEDLRRILRTVLDVRKAAAGDQVALARVRRDFGPLDPDYDQRIETAAGTIFRKARDLYPADYFTQDDRTILIKASDWAALGLSNGLLQSQARPYVFEPAQLFPDARIAPGGLRVGVLPETLLGFCYLTVASMIASEPIAICDECNRVYVVNDKRQRFCEPACANRARFQRFKTNQTVKATPKKKGTRDGKKTR